MDLSQVILGLLGLAGGLIAFKALDNWNVNKNQAKLEQKVVEVKVKEAGLEGEQKQEDKQTKENVDAITKEQNDKPVADDLASWFDHRK